MTPFKRDCINISSAKKEVYLADGTKIICRNVGEILIPVTSTNGLKYTLRLKDVLIIPELDRRLFSVSSFLNQGNSWVNFRKGYIELGVKSGPIINIPLTALQSSAMMVQSAPKVKGNIELVSNFNKRKAHHESRANKKKISSDVIHSRFHKPQGVIATIQTEELWSDVDVVPSHDSFCTSCKLHPLLMLQGVEQGHLIPKSS